MARIRSIKPEFFTSEDICSLTVKARLAYVGLWCHADREGRMKDAPITLAAAIMPTEMKEFPAILSELCDAGHITRYSVDSKKYLFIPTFNEHQRPHKTERASIIPPLINGVLTVKSTLKDVKPSTGKGKGKGKGKVINKGIEYPDWLDMAAWDDWKQHRKEIKKPMTPLAEQMAIKKLRAMANGITQRQIIDNSISNGYQGLYAPNKQNGKQERTGNPAASRPL